jgi:hypothetical protein
MHAETRRAILAEMCERGLFTELLDDGQRKWIEDFRNIDGDHVWCIGRQRGKTFAAVAEMLETIALNPGHVGIYCAKTKDSASQIVIPTIQQITAYLPELVRPEIKDGHRISFHSEGGLRWAGTDAQTFERLRGPYSDRILLDESAFYQDLPRVEAALLPQLTTTRSRGGKALYLSSPPETPDHDFTDRYNAAIVAGTSQHSTIEDNPRLTKDDVLRILDDYAKKHNLTREQALKSSFWRREYMAEFVIEESRAIVPEWDKTCIEEAPEKDDLRGYYHNYIAMDLGVEDLTVVLFAYYDFRKALLYVLDEFVMNGPELTTPVLAEAIKAKEAHYFGEKRPYRRISDNNNPHLLNDMLSLHGLPFMATDKGELQAMVNEVRIACTNRRIRVSPRCKHLIGCLSTGIWDGAKGQRREFGRSKAFGHYDALAALVYLVRNLDETTNPIPAMHGLNIHNQHIGRKILDQRPGEVWTGLIGGKRR